MKLAGNYRLSSAVAEVLPSKGQGVGTSPDCHRGSAGLPCIISVLRAFSRLLFAKQMP
jgi:hypothetical protein